MKPSPPIILQRVIPHYRRPFFEAVYDRYGWKVVAAEKPPSGTFLNLVDPKELPFAESFPMSFASNGRNCYIDTGALITRFSPPAILAEFSMRMSSSFTLPIARRLGRLERLAFWTHGWSMERPFHSLPDYASQIGRLPLLAAADRVLTYTEEGTEWLQRYLNKNRVSALGNAIDDGPIRAAAAVANSVPLGRPAFLSVGRLTADKGFDKLIRIFNQLASTYPNATLTLVGDGPERNRLVTIAGERMGKSIFFTGALYAEEELAPLFLSADLYLLAGAAGLSVNHALAYGLPVVAFPRGPRGPLHHPEIEYVRHGHTGWFAKDYTDQAFSDAIGEALKRFDYPDARGAIMHYARSTMSVSMMLDNFGAFINRLKE
jgi:glycosyltransferase involved in cell wall biosynthesis